MNAQGGEVEISGGGGPPSPEMKRLRHELHIAYLSMVGHIAGAVAAVCLAYAIYKGVFQCL